MRLRCGRSGGPAAIPSCFRFRSVNRRTIHPSGARAPGLPLLRREASPARPKGYAGVLAVLLGLLFGAASPGVAWAQTASAVCERALPAAEDQYRDAAYDDALRLVAACLDQGEKTDAQAVAAYELLALIHLKKDEIERARAAVVNLLGVDPTYTVDPIAQPPSYVSLIAIVQRDLQAREEVIAEEERSRTPFFRRTGTWMTLGTIVVGSGIATALTIGGGGSGGDGPGSSPPDSNPLPIPPGTP